MQAHGVVNGVIEREVDIVGIVRENVLQVLAQRIGQFILGRIIQLGFYLGSDIGHKRQLILDFRVADTVALVLVDHRTRG